MTRGFRQSQALLHTWSGLLMGWLLFLVFVAGTIAFYREGLNRWMRPELARIGQPMEALAGAQSFLEKKAPDADSWFITLAGPQSPGVQLFWVPKPMPGDVKGRRRGGGGRRDNQALIGGDGRRAEVRETRGGDFFYRLHFDLHYMPVFWARWAVGLATMMMLVAILSGIVTHKKIFRDFFTLRRNRGQRSWLDGHNATAVLALPFHLMITYTGLVTLMAMLMPWGVVATYADRTAFDRRAFPVVPATERSGQRAPLIDLPRLVRNAEARLGAPAGVVTVSFPGDAAARVSVYRAPSTMLNTRPPGLAYDGVTGHPVWHSPEPGSAAVTAGAMIGLHAGRFADPWLRFLYFLCGVAGSVMVASGLVLWTVKRRGKLPDPARPAIGFRVVERLNVAAIAGLPAGIAAMFWANRLLPIGMANRAAWEVHCLFLVWGASLATVLVIGPRRAWPLILAAAGALLLALFLYDAMWLPVGLFRSLASGDDMAAGIEAALLVFGAAFLLVARHVAGYRPPVRRRARTTTVPTMAMRHTVLEPAE